MTVNEKTTLVGSSRLDCIQLMMDRGLSLPNCMLVWRPDQVHGLRLDPSRVVLHHRTPPELERAVRAGFAIPPLPTFVCVCEILYAAASVELSYLSSRESAIGLQGTVTTTAGRRWRVRAGSGGYTGAYGGSLWLDHPIDIYEIREGGPN